jgi:transcriptional regulator with XRE-family HTH domain
MPACNRIKDLRLDRRWSQAQLARELSEKLGRGVKKDTVGLYERGDRRVPDDILSGLADTFNVTADYLMGRSDNPTVLTPTIPSGNEQEFEKNIGEYVRKVMWIRDILMTGQPYLSLTERQRLTRTILGVIQGGWPHLLREAERRRMQETELAKDESDLLATLNEMDREQ